MVHLIQNSPTFINPSALSGAFDFRYGCPDLTETIDLAFEPLKSIVYTDPGIFKSLPALIILDSFISNSSGKLPPNSLILSIRISSELSATSN